MSISNHSKKYDNLHEMLKAAQALEGFQIIHNVNELPRSRANEVSKQK